MPKASVTELERFADWTEICALLEPTGGVSRATLADAVRGGLLVGGTPEDLPVGDETFLDPSTLSESEAGERFVERVWEQLEIRIAQLSERYPYEFQGDRLLRRVDSWRDMPAFTLLLIADLSGRYPGSGISIEPSSGFPMLFEVIVTAAQRGFLRGASVRFGWPPGVPGSIEGRIRTLGDSLGLTVEMLGGKVEPHDKDRGLDVVTRLCFGDDGSGTVTMLTQCATGKNWRDKQGEPAFGEWHNILKWESKLIRAVAIPWRLNGRKEYVRNHLHFDEAVILDRMRLVYGEPDKYLSNGDRSSITAWCKDQIKKLPHLE